MPGTQALRCWLILGIVLLGVRLMSQRCHVSRERVIACGRDHGGGGCWP